MKRLISLVLCCALVLACVCFSSGSASAASSDFDSINILDYIDLSGGLTIFSSKPYYYLEMPFDYPLCYFDLTLEFFYEMPSAVYLYSASGNKTSLKVSNIEGNTYRVYGSMPSDLYLYSAKFGLYFDITNYVYVNVLKFDVYTVSNSGVGDIGELAIMPPADNNTGFIAQSSFGVPLSREFYYYSDGVQFFDFTATLSSVNWRDFDYMDFLFEVNASNIDYINCRIGTSSLYGQPSGSYVPFDIGFLNGDVIDKNEYIGSGSTTVIPASTQWTIFMRIYIPPELRDAGSLYIEVGGQYKSPASRVRLCSVKGYYYTHVPDPSLLKLDQIEQAIKNSMSSSEAQNAASQATQNQITANQNKVDSGIASLETMNRPSVDDMGFTDPDLIVNADGLSLLNTMIAPLYRNELILGIMIIAAALAHLSFCYFGRK